jgi:hypothetical protein
MQISIRNSFSSEDHLVPMRMFCTHPTELMYLLDNASSIPMVYDVVIKSFRDEELFERVVLRLDYGKHFADTSWEEFHQFHEKQQRRLKWAIFERKTDRVIHTYSLFPAQFHESKFAFFPKHLTSAKSILVKFYFKTHEQASYFVRNVTVCSVIPKDPQIVISKNIIYHPRDINFSFKVPFLRKTTGFMTTHLISNSISSKTVMIKTAFKNISFSDSKTQRKLHHYRDEHGNDIYSIFRWRNGKFPIDKINGNFSSQILVEKEDHALIKLVIYEADVCFYHQGKIFVQN